MIEYEIKAKLDDQKAFTNLITSLGGRYGMRLMQTDTYLTNDVLDFPGEGSVFRMRVSTGDGIGKSSFITYKGPKIDEKTKSREELEFGVSDPNIALDVLRRMNFAVVLSIKKTRQEYYLGMYTVCVDHVDELGWFAEIEQTSRVGEIDRPQEELLSAARMLHLDNQERRSYLELMMEKRKNDGKATQD